MRKTFVIYPLAIMFPVSFLHAKAKESGKNEYLSATVVQVQKLERQSNYVGDSPTDAPLRAEVNIFNISVRVSCGTYVGRYESAFNYLPAIFTPNRPVKVRLQKHVMFVDVPGDQEYKMGIVERPRGSKTCDENH